MPAEGAVQASDTGATANPSRLRYAVKTALALTLAYLVPMAMGWPQPQTAATTVMLIAATGAVSDSLQKGVLRVLGTVAGAVIGLSLVALFPQERLLYLSAVSITVAVFFYLYNAYQGDSTLFMLAAVVTLMVFNGGDAEGAFLYGVDRAFMTAFGVVVYTAVASLLWPVRVADDTRRLAGDVASPLRACTEALLNPEGSGVDVDERLSRLLASQTALRSYYDSVKQTSDSVAAHRAEWDAVMGCYEELESLLAPALRAPEVPELRFQDHIENYERILERISGLLAWIETSWQGRRSAQALEAIPVAVRPESLSGVPHLAVATIASRAEFLQQAQALLLELASAMDSLLFDRGGFTPGRKPSGKAAFLWLDRENLVTALRAFFTFWVATAVWIVFNPPGGFMFVTLCTVLIPLVSYTPVTPRLLFILFSLGFLFAVPAYVFLLPHMQHWLQLGGFLFGYALFGFLVFPGPLSIFYLLGLFTLGIQNTMSYNFNAILLLVLMFYLVCSLLILSVHVPFTSRPELIYARLRRRFFRLCARALESGQPASRPPGLLARARDAMRAAALDKLQTFGARLDSRYYPGANAGQIADFQRACERLHGQLQVLARRQTDFGRNGLIARARDQRGPDTLARLCGALADTTDPAELERTFAEVRASLAGVESRLDDFLVDRRDDLHELAGFYLYLNLQAALAKSIEACRVAQNGIDWPQLRQSRFH